MRYIKINFKLVNDLNFKCKIINIIEGYISKYCFGFFKYGFKRKQFEENKL